MPIIEYECEKCHEIFEVIEFKQIDIKDKVECKFCGEEAKKIISKNTFKLNGECWAKDNYSYEYSNSKVGSSEKKTKGKVNALGKGLNAMKTKK